MVKVRDIPIDVLEKIDPKIIYRHKRKYLRDDQYLFFDSGKIKKSTNEFIELIAEWYFAKGVLYFLDRFGIMEGSYMDFFKDYMVNLEFFLNHTWDHGLSKKIPLDEHITQRNNLLFLGQLRADTFLDIWFKESRPLIKKCICDRLFVAYRKDTKFCDTCRKIRNLECVREYRAKHPKKSLDPKLCEYCNNEFTPKTTRARFCSDKCRVRASRAKKN